MRNWKVLTMLTRKEGLEKLLLNQPFLLSPLLFGVMEVIIQDLLAFEAEVWYIKIKRFLIQ